MKDINFYIVIFIVLPILMIFSFRGQDQILKAVNRKRRYGVYLTAILFSIPMWIFIVLSKNLQGISSYTTIDIKILGVVTFLLLFISFGICNKILFIPANYKRYEKEKVLRKQNFKGWKYYVIQYPASSMKNMLKLPPISKHSKVNPKFIKEYHINKLKTPPLHIQFILILITYIFTSLGFYILDYIVGTWSLIYFNLYILPFILLIGFMGDLIFVMIRVVEYIFKIKINEIVKFLLFNIIFVLIVGGVWLRIK
ncbi:hypothetical protein [Anaeromicrobium sediminis]|uniref:Uncharacterized protein n=1 Tax=Anaeromicrobium sediminis TaxID=1478221 RepID=A0A267MN84_9FIRM|nr:hypothetical protein [Anaeromicrobium sediminis]PAB60335.1 hypothetical protein CCE28_05420 [Anaeromicrobium sediminis]